MSHSCIIYGFIKSPGILNDEVSLRTYKLNKKIIKSIDKFNNEYYYIDNKMFSFLPFKKKIDDKIPQYNYNIIHFGASYKDLFYEWSEWILSFENIIKRLYWYEVILHYQGMPESFTCSWEISDSYLEKLDYELNEPTVEWYFNGKREIGDIYV